MQSYNVSGCKMFVFRRSDGRQKFGRVSRALGTSLIWNCVNQFGAILLADVIK